MLTRLLAAILALAAFGLAWGEEFSASIVKVDGDKVTLKRLKKKGEAPEEMTLLVATAGVKVHRGMFSKDTKKFETGEPIEGGLKNEMFAGPTLCRVTTGPNKDRITQVLVVAKKK